MVKQSKKICTFARRMDEGPMQVQWKCESWTCVSCSKTSCKLREFCRMTHVGSVWQPFVASRMSYVACRKLQVASVWHLPYTNDHVCVEVFPSLYTCDSMKIRIIKTRLLTPWKGDIFFPTTHRGITDSWVNRKPHFHPWRKEYFELPSRGSNPVQMV